MVPENPRAFIVVVHGLGDHAGRYLPFMEFFADKGYAVMVYDQRGHGRSSGKRGDVDRFETWVHDLKTLVLEAQKYFKSDIPFFIVGHSLGGLVALHHAATCHGEVDGVVVSAPAIKPNIDISGWKKRLLRVISILFPKSTIDAGIDPKFLSRDDRVVRVYENDPLVVRRFTLRAGKAMLDAGVRIAEHAGAVQCPVLMVHSKGDRICLVEGTENFYTALNGNSNKLILYEGDYHEPFNDIDKDKVFDDIYLWLDGKVQGGKK